MDFYQQLVKPGWAPPPRTFGIMWGILYPMIALAYGWALVQVARGAWPKTLLVPVLVNLIANVAFTPILFGLHNLALAEIDVILVLATVTWSILALWPLSHLVALLLVPYAAWVCIATALQTSITWLNK